MRRVAIWSGCRCGYRRFGVGIGVGNGDGLFATVASWSVAVEFNRRRLSSTTTVVGVVDYIWVRHCWLGFVELFLIRVLCGMCRSVYCLVRDEILAFNGLGWTETLSLGSNLEAQWKIKFINDDFAKKSKYHRWSACWCCTLKIFLSL